jgi:hypothetical protein
MEAGWIAFWILFAVVMIFDVGGTRLLVKAQKKVMQDQSREVQRQQKIIDKFANFYHAIFQMEKLKVGAKMAADGKKIEMVAVHPDPAIQAEGQAELNNLLRLIEEVRTGKEKRGSLN